MSTSHLTIMVEATHRSLHQRLAEADRALAEHTRAGEVHARVDALMAATSRHLAAVEGVLVPEVARRGGEGHGSEEYLDRARDLEKSLTRLKGRLYGEQHVAHLPWPEVWDDIRTRLEQHNEAERRLVDDLVTVLAEEQDDDLATAVYRAELKAPTRAHPFIPHTGLLGVVARRIFALADGFWDVAQNRVVPPPVRPRPKRREHESLMTQFLLGEPTLDAEAPVFRHGEEPPHRRAG